jgi:hypothetical protein
MASTPKQTTKQAYVTCGSRTRQPLPPGESIYQYSTLMGLGACHDVHWACMCWSEHVGTAFHMQILSNAPCIHVQVVNGPAMPRGVKRESVCVCVWAAAVPMHGLLHVHGECSSGRSSSSYVYACTPVTPQPCCNTRQYTHIYINHTHKVPIHCCCVYIYVK